MDYARKPGLCRPRIIIHGGAGHVTRENLPPRSYNIYRDVMLKILRTACAELSRPDSSAIDVAVFAVSILEANPLFNAGRGAVYTTSGTHELEASVMVSNGYQKRGVGVTGLKRVRNPIKLAKEMLIRGDTPDGGGAQGHSQLHGETCERLAVDWGLDLVKPSYFWTRRRWDEHRKGLNLSHDDETYERAKRDADRGCSAATDPDETVYDQDSRSIPSLKDFSWDGKEYLPQGTVGAVVLDRSGTLCVATSTGGLTNKLPGRIGDTPTLGAGFWAEEWTECDRMQGRNRSDGSTIDFSSIFAGCLPGIATYAPLSSSSTFEDYRNKQHLRAVAMSGTGNGDSFLRVNAVRTAAAIARYSSNRDRSVKDQLTLQQAVTAVAGPSGQLQRSAGDRWGVTGEGEGGIIGIELAHGTGKIVYDFNCGGMFRVWKDDDERDRFAVFKSDEK